MAKPKVKCRRCAVREIRRRWTETFKNAQFDQLVQVQKFSFGGFSKVSLVQLKDHPTSAFALKSIRKDRIVHQIDRDNLLTEKAIMSEIESDFIVKLYKTFKDTKHFYFVTEYCSGGEMSNLRHISESDAKFYVACVVEALACLHGKNIVFNDLKPENLVLDEDGYVRLIDFGLAKKLKEGELAYGSGGTAKYLPPEVAVSLVAEAKACEGRDRGADLWALGCLLFYFVEGRTPFADVNYDGSKLFKNIITGIDAVDFSEGLWSTAAVDVMRKLWHREPKSRLGYYHMEDLRNHPWFEGFNWEELRARRMKAPKEPKVDSVIDTSNFQMGEISDSDAEEDESDWDLEF